MARRESPDSNSPQNSPPTGRSFTSSSLLGHFTAITSSLQRRLSGGVSPVSDPPSPPSSSHATTTTTTHTHTHLSHDSDPSLSPIALQGFKESTTERVLSEKLAEEIRLMLPARLQIQETWDLVYSLDQHGVSLSTLYSRSNAFNSPRAGFVVIVKDRRDGVFGAYLSDFPHVHPHYFGNGECFLFKFTQIHTSSTMNLPALGHSATVPLAARARDHAVHHAAVFAEEDDHDHLDIPRPGSRASVDTTFPHYQFRGYSYTGLNDYMILCTPQFLSVGGGDGKYGLFLDDVFENGISSPCPAFGNESLSTTEKFKIENVEVWRIGGTGGATGFVYAWDNIFKGMLRPGAEECQIEEELDQQGYLNGLSR